MVELLKGVVISLHGPELNDMFLKIIQIIEAEVTPLVSMKYILAAFRALQILLVLTIPSSAEFRPYFIQA